jgi:hypothetical protein
MSCAKKKKGKTKLPHEIIQCSGKESKWDGV